MASFLFKWDHPASEVYVTGTFDDWKKTEKLEKVGERFEKDVKLPDSFGRIYYKFVVDGNWVTDHTAPRETDESGIENNVLTPERVISEAPATLAIMNNIVPESTTAEKAAEAPLENGHDAKEAELPGAFPETPAGEIGINPMPAAAGAVNPIKLAPGEKIPDTVATESTTSNVKLDAESYEKSDALPGGAPAAFSSAAPESTTAALAAGAPIENAAPEIVKESQDKAGVDPEASGMAAEVSEKAAVEDELKSKVVPAPSTSEGTAGKGTEKTESAVTPGEAAASVAAAASAVGAAVVANAVVAKDAVADKAAETAAAAQEQATSAATQLPAGVKEQLPESVQETVAGKAQEETRQEVSPEVPAEVKDSLTQAAKDPEAAANTAAVEDKKTVEAELLQEVKPAAAVDDKPSKEEKKAEKEVKKEEKKQANGNGAAAEPSTPSKAGDSGAVEADSAASTTEKKKKNRLSAMIGKIKDKIQHK